MQCRPIQPNELDALTALYKHLIEVDEPLPARDALMDVWQDVLDSKWHDCLVMVDEHDQLIASLTITYSPNLTRGARPHALIENVVVDTQFRRQGLGQQLMQYAIDQAWGRGCYKVALLARESEETKRFYESLGFSGKGKLAYVLR